MLDLIDKMEKRKPNTNKLLKYGFTDCQSRFSYSEEIDGGGFRFDISVTDSGKITTAVIDKETNEEYTLIHSPTAFGAFVGRIRSECEVILGDIFLKCYDRGEFTGDIANSVSLYAKKKYGTEPEFLWDDTPDSGIFRDEKSKKWYAAVLTAKKRSVGIDCDGTIEIIDLKETPENILNLIKKEGYFPGYHMNKKHWYTILLDGTVPLEEICQCIDRSYNLITNKQSKGRKIH